MEIIKRFKWIAAVSLLAVGVPTAGIALASPAEPMSISKPVPVTHQANQTPLNKIQLCGTCGNEYNECICIYNEPAQSSVPAPQVQSVRSNNVSVPVCGYNNCRNINQCINTSPPSSQVKSTVNNSAGHKYQYNYAGQSTRRGGNNGYGGRK